MSSLERKFGRKNANKAKKKAEKELAVKVALFGRLSDHCLTCEKKFDKTNKEQVLSWSVVVEEQKEIVRLYCPECWNGAKKMLEEIKEKLAQEQKEKK